MFIIIWHYTVYPQHLESFSEYYNSSGEWVKFFRPSAAYIETEFFQTESENRFITIDKWTSEKAYLQYLTSNKKKYEEIDKLCEGFTSEETLIGKYFLLEF